MSDPRFNTGDPIMDAALAADDAKLEAMGVYDEPTNPPVPATPLDVEACVNPERLRNLADRILNMADGRADRDPASLRREAEFVRALASALPGMGKDSEGDRERQRWLAMTSATVLADEDGFYVSWRDAREPWAQRRCATDSFASANEAIDAARAAQPEETSDAG